MILIIIAMIIAVTLIILTINNKEKSGNQNHVVPNNTNHIEMNNIADENITSEEKIVFNKKIHRVDSTNEYYTVDKSIRNYLLYSKVGNQRAIKGISNNNIFNQSDTAGSLKIKDMYAVDNENGTTYFMELKLSNSTYYILLLSDFKNDTFAIYNLSYDQYRNIINEGGEANYTQYIEVPKNEFNKIQHVNLSKSEIAEKYLDSYIQNARYDTEEAYNSLNEEYKKKRFGSYQNYVAYLSEENKARQLASLDHNSIREQEEFSSEEEYVDYINSLSQASIQRYDTYSKDGKEYYIVLDSYHNFYIFETTSVMNYKLYLDSYTIGLEYFENQYDEKGKTRDEKIQINIEKIFEALNNKDYEYVYHKIDEKVRTETFKNYETFANYMQRGLFNNNSIELEDYTEEDEVGTYKIKITDKEGKSMIEMPMTISMELDDEIGYIIVKILFEE